MGNHRAGVHAGYIIKHKLKLTGLINNNAELICNEINQMIGIDNVSIDGDKHTIKLAYDASIRNIDEIRSIWILFFDRTSQENLPCTTTSQHH